MKRRLLNLLTGGSLLLAMVAVLLWVRSEFVDDIVFVRIGQATLLRVGPQLGWFSLDYYHGVRVPIRWQYSIWKSSGPRFPFMAWELGKRPSTGQWWGVPGLMGTYHGVDEVVVGPDGAAIWTDAPSKIVRATARYSGPLTCWESGVALWVILLLCLAQPLGRASLWYIRSTIRRTRKAGGLCFRCGYDLRATPDQCPECGVTL